MDSHKSLYGVNLLDASENPLQHKWRCRLCLGSCNVHTVESRTTKNEGTRLFFRCLDGRMAVEDYPRTLPYEVVLALGHTLTRPQYYGYRRAQEIEDKLASRV